MRGYPQSWRLEQLLALRLPSTSTPLRVLAQCWGHPPSSCLGYNSAAGASTCSAFIQHFLLPPPWSRASSHTYRQQLDYIPFPTKQEGRPYPEERGTSFRKLHALPLSVFLVGRVRKRVKVRGKMLKEPSFKELPEAYGKESKPRERFGRARTKSEANNTKQVDVWNIRVLSTKILVLPWYFSFSFPLTWGTAGLHGGSLAGAQQSSPETHTFSFPGSFRLRAITRYSAHQALVCVRIHSSLHLLNEFPVLRAPGACCVCAYIAVCICWFQIPHLSALLPALRSPLLLW